MEGDIESREKEKISGILYVQTVVNDPVGKKKMIWEN